MPKNAAIFICENCAFKCCKKSNYITHLTTAKHIKSTKLNTYQQQKCGYTCLCGKVYKERTGLWKHKKICSNSIVTLPLPMPLPMPDMSLILELLKDNQEFKKIMAEQNKAIVELVGKMGNATTTTTTTTTTNNTNSNNNSNNKQFNLNFFLNDTCKDAINASDFAKSLIVEKEDLSYVQKKGYTEGFTNIFLKNLNRLGKFAKPFWNTDDKRETIHVKNDGKWKIDDENKSLRRVIGTSIYHKCNLALIDMKNNDPDMSNPEHKRSEDYVAITQAILGKEPWHTGQDFKENNDAHSIDKVVKKVIPKIKVPKAQSEQL